MLITTANDFTDHETEQALGEVFGSDRAVTQPRLPDRSPASRSLVGGELQGPQQAIERLVEQATRRGGNAIVAVHQATSKLGSTWTQICADVTAVIARWL